MNEKKPFVTLNKLAEFLTANPVRQKAIVKQMKYGDPPGITQYRDAHDMASKFLGSGMDPQVLQDGINNLIAVNGITPQNYRERSIEALRRLESTLPLSIEKADLHALAPNAKAYIDIEGLEVRVRPDALLSRTRRGITEVGALKIHFPKGKKNLGLGEDGRECVAVILYEYLQTMSSPNSVPKFSLCYSVDVYPGVVCACPKGYVNLMKNVREACRNYNLKWHSI